MTPNDHIRVILVTGARKAIQIELTNEGAVVGMFEVLGQIFMGKGGLIVDVEGISVGGEGENLGVQLGDVGNEEMSFCESKNSIGDEYEC